MSEEAACEARGVVLISDYPEHGYHFVRRADGVIVPITEVTMAKWEKEATQQEKTLREMEK